VYASRIAGWMEYLRHAAGRLPSRCPTDLIAATIARLPYVALVHGPVSYNSRAASTVPAQVRKSLAVKSCPQISRMYRLKSAESTRHTSPLSSTYWNSS